MVLGFCGSGNMAAAMARGWTAADGGPEDMLFADSGSGRAAALAEEVGGEAVSLEGLAERADLVVLAVKPKALDDVAPALAGSIDGVISVLGATSTDRLRRALGSTPVLRTMPNLAVEIGRGVICHTPLEGDAEILADAVRLLALIGTTFEVPEDRLDAATAVMGCSPAYLALVCEALIAAGVDAGLDPELSDRLVRESAAGLGEHQIDRAPADLQHAIASPGGSTEAGLDSLRSNDVPDAFRAAVAASLERMAGTR
jgi:pyrroline-5-carboxylate reductase